jgi:hypothetical protein
LFNLLNISRADIPCVLVGETTLSMQSVTLYVTVNIINITPPAPYNSPPSIPTAYDGSPAEEAPILGPIQSPSEHPLPPLSHHQSVETGITMPQSQEGMSHTSAKDPRLALHQADEAMKRTIPIDGSNTWESAVGKIKWVMDTLGPIAEVSATPF